MDLKNDQILQAVIFAESFDAKCEPLTLSTSKTLTPLDNRPMLAYTLDTLARSSIQETFIFCNQYAQLIKDFVKEYQLKLSTKMNIQIFVSEEYTNIGAVIRDLDAKGVIKSNFVLLNGDCVDNLQLNELIDVHKRNVKSDPGCIMTTLFKKASPNHRNGSPADSEIVLLLDFKQKIVFLENNPENKQADIPLKLLNETDVSVHFDLIDTHVSICSNKVPPDFSDNFDFENRDDFINGLLADDELLQHYIYAHILNDGEELYFWCADANEDDDTSSVSTSFSDSSDNESCHSQAFDEFDSFFNEVYDSLQRGIEEKLIAENLILEINSSKHAYNVPMNVVNSVVLKAILKLTQQAGGNFLVTLKEHMKYMLPVIQNYIRSDESQKDCIYSLEEFYLSNDDTIRPVVFVKILQYFYDKNVLSEDTILPWFNEPDYLPEHEVKDQKRLREQKELILFTKWLSEAEEESDSDSD